MLESRTGIQKLLTEPFGDDAHRVYVSFSRASAVAELSRRLREAEDGEKRGRVSSERREQVGGGDRSEKIRTYHWTRGVTDHRSGRKVGDVAAVMRGERLGELFLVDERVSE